MKTVGFATLGCRLNQVESQEMRALVEKAGYRAVDEGEAAEVYVVNTWTVTMRGAFSDRQASRRITRGSPDALVVVTGCWAQTDPDALVRMPGVDLVLGNHEKYRLPELLGSLVKRDHPEFLVGKIADVRHVPSAPMTRMSGRSRAFVKIQDGCPRQEQKSRARDPRGTGRGARRGGLWRDHPDRRRHRPLRLGPRPSDEPCGARGTACRDRGPSMAQALLGAAGIFHP